MDFPDYRDFRDFLENRVVRINFGLILDFLEGVLGLFLDFVLLGYLLDFRDFLVDFRDYLGVSSFCMKKLLKDQFGMVNLTSPFSHLPYWRYCRFSYCRV